MKMPDAAVTVARPLRIGIDARLVTYRRGMGTYVYHLLQEFALRDDSHEFLLYVDDPRAIDELPSHPRFQVSVLAPRFYPVWEQCRLAAAVRRDNLDILHCPANTGPMAGLDGTRLVLTIHDVMFLMPYAQLPASPSWYQRLGRMYRRFVVPKAARIASRIITVSERSAEDARRFLELRDTPVDVVMEAPNASCRVVQDRAAVQRSCAALGAGADFVLAPGAVDPRKNTVRVLEAFARVRGKLPAGTQLVMFGLTAAGVERFHAMARALAIESHVVLLGFITDEELVALYNGCRVFLYPSLYEGFGLPLLEALACGAAVATSRAGSLPEIGGEAVEYAEPLDVGSIAEALLRADAGRGGDARERGVRRAGSFTWREAAARTMAVYEAASRSEARPRGG